MDAANEILMSERVARLESIAEHTALSLDLMQRRSDDGFKRVDEGFKEMRAEIKASAEQLRADMNANSQQLRVDMTSLTNALQADNRALRGEMGSNLRLLISMHITTLLGIVALFAKAGKLF